MRQEAVVPVEVERLAKIKSRSSSSATVPSECIANSIYRLAELLIRLS
jgi:hypothetical protein